MHLKDHLADSRNHVSTQKNALMNNLYKLEFNVQKSTVKELPCKITMQAVMLLREQQSGVFGLILSQLLHSRGKGETQQEEVKALRDFCKSLSRSDKNCSAAFLFSFFFLFYLFIYLFIYFSPVKSPMWTFLLFLRNPPCFSSSSDRSFICSQHTTFCQKWYKLNCFTAEGIIESLRLKKTFKII